MIKNAATLAYLCQVTGKPVLNIWDDIEQKEYFFLIDSFSPANPGNHKYDNDVVGRDMQGVLVSIGGFSHGHDATSDQAIQTKINDLPITRFTFSGLRWVKFTA